MTNADLDRPGKTDGILAIDLGTSGPKVALVSVQGEVLACEIEKTPVMLLPGGGAEQDPNDWWVAICTATRRILETADFIKAAIRAIPELFILGDPLWVIAFGSRTLDIYRVMDAMRHRGWSLNGLHRPSCVHLCVTLRHTQPGVKERFAEDLQAAVADVKTAPAAEGGMAPVYGMAATLPLRGVVSNILKAYMDVLYKT